MSAGCFGGQECPLVVSADKIVRLLFRRTRVSACCFGGQECPPVVSADKSVRLLFRRTFLSACCFGGQECPPHKPDTRSCLGSSMRAKRYHGTMNIGRYAP